MTRTRFIIWGIGFVSIVAVGLGNGSRAHAQSAEPSAMPRSLNGAPASRVSSHARRKPALEPSRTRPEPSIVVDPQTRLGRVAGEKRSASLLDREIALLLRLVKGMAVADARRADVLLRLSYAYQELIWIQQQRVHALQITQSPSCSCARDSDATAVACAAPVRRGDRAL